MKTHTTPKRLAPGLILAVALLAGTALAARDIDETHKVKSDARISVENLAGSVEVTGWDRDEVHITGTLDEKAEKLEVEGGESSLSIEVKYPRERNLNVEEGSHLKISVPQGCQLDVECVSSDVSVEDVTGKIAVETISGEIVLRGEARSVEAESISGDLDIRVDTDSADLSTVSGTITVDGVGGEVQLETVSGDIEVQAARPLKELDAEAVSGDLELHGEPARDGEWSLSSHSGDIDLYIPEDVDAEFSIETFSGDIRDAFGNEPSRRSKYAPGQQLEFTRGDGSAEIDIECFSGDVTIRTR